MGRFCAPFFLELFFSEFLKLKTETHRKATQVFHWSTTTTQQHYNRSSIVDQLVTYSRYC